MIGNSSIIPVTTLWCHNKKIKILKCCGVCFISFSQKGPKCPIILSLISKIHCFYYYFFPHPKSKLMIGNTTIIIITTLWYHIKKIKILKCCGVCLKSFSQKGPKLGPFWEMFPRHLPTLLYPDFCFLTSMFGNDDNCGVLMQYHNK